MDHSSGGNNEHKDEPKVEADIKLFNNHIENHDARNCVLMLLSEIANFEITKYNTGEDTIFLFSSSFEFNVPQMEESPEIVIHVKEMFQKNHLQNAIDNES